MIYRAIVVDNRDPRNAGRIKVNIPHLGGGGATDWIWPVITSGFWVIPKPGDQVWVAFEAGDEEMPVWLGAIKPEGSYTDPNTGISLEDVRNLLYRLVHLERRVASLEAVHDYSWSDAPTYGLGDPGVTNHPGNFPDHVH